MNAYYFGLQYGVYCFFGLANTNLTLYGGIRPDSECSMYCTGNDTTTNGGLGPTNFGIMCGNVYRNSVYYVGVRGLFLVTNL